MITRNAIHPEMKRARWLALGQCSQALNLHVGRFARLSPGKLDQPPSVLERGRLVDGDRLLSDGQRRPDAGQSAPDEQLVGRQAVTARDPADRGTVRVAFVDDRRLLGRGEAASTPSAVAHVEPLRPPPARAYA